MNSRATKTAKQSFLVNVIEDGGLVYHNKQKLQFLDLDSLFNEYTFKIFRIPLMKWILLGRWVLKYSQYSPENMYLPKSKEITFVQVNTCNSIT